MKWIALGFVAFVVGCSSNTVDAEKRVFEKLGVTNPESKNFVRGMGALHASCSQSDSTSIQACQFYKEQVRYIVDMEQFLKTSFHNPDSLTGTDRTVFNNITLIGATYREYVQAKQDQADSERLWNSFAAGAAIGTLFSRPAPSPQPNCYVHDAHTSSAFLQCQ
jgi:hypothetical protein